MRRLLILGTVLLLLGLALRYVYPKPLDDGTTLAGQQ